MLHHVLNSDSSNLINPALHQTMHTLAATATLQEGAYMPMTTQTKQPEAWDLP